MKYIFKREELNDIEIEADTLLWARAELASFLGANIEMGKVDDWEFEITGSTKLSPKQNKKRG